MKHQVIEIDGIDPLYEQIVLRRILLDCHIIELDFSIIPFIQELLEMYLIPFYPLLESPVGDFRGKFYPKITWVRVPVIV